MSRRSDVLELAVLGLLQESGLHGYELRKRLNALLGPFRALSYGTLYPCLKSLLADGWIREADRAPASLVQASATAPASPLGGRRAKIVYELTAEGKEHFQSLVTHPGPAAWEDERFDVHFAFFARTDAVTRLQILEGRRSRLEERREGYRQSMQRSRERAEQYTLELQRHGLDSVDSEVRWLSELIDTERASNMTHPPDDGDRPLPPAASGPDHDPR
jgi:DNA-binding PadR family transcriptional regulator